MIIWTIVYWGLHWGPPISGIFHIIPISLAPSNSSIVSRGLQIFLGLAVSLLQSNPRSPGTRIVGPWVIGSIGFRVKGLGFRVQGLGFRVSYSRSLGYRSYTFI